MKTNISSVGYSVQLGRGAKFQSTTPTLIKVVNGSDDLRLADLQAANITVQEALTAANGEITNLTGTSITVSGSITGTSITVSGSITGNLGQFSSINVQSLSGKNATFEEALTSNEIRALTSMQAPEIHAETSLSAPVAVFDSLQIPSFGFGSKNVSFEPLSGYKTLGLGYAWELFSTDLSIDVSSIKSYQISKFHLTTDDGDLTIEYVILGSDDPYLNPMKSWEALVSNLTLQLPEGATVSYNAETNLLTFTGVNSLETYIIKDSTISAQFETGILNGDFGLEESRYVSNCILGFKTVASFQNNIISIGQDPYCLKLSDGRDFDSANRLSTMKSTIRYVSDLQLDVSNVLSEDGTYYIIYDDSNPSLQAVNVDFVAVDDIEPPADGLMLFYRNPSLNSTFKYSSNVWVPAQWIKIGKLIVESGAANFYPDYPVDLLKQSDYINADSSSSSSKVMLYSKFISAQDNVSGFSSITLTEGPCISAENLFVAVGNTIMDTNQYTLNEDGTVVTFIDTIPAGISVNLRWFSNSVLVASSIIASDAVWDQGTSTVRCPTVRQVKDYIQQVLQNLNS
jgi:hypothetical protein